jgi:hypothetical protein
VNCIVTIVTVDPELDDPSTKTVASELKKINCVLSACLRDRSELLLCSSMLDDAHGASRKSRY